MAGYDGFSKSNNAVSAERAGRFPLSKAAKLAGVPADLVKEFVPATEWHHSSKFYNRIDYYDVEEIQAYFGLLSADKAEAWDEPDAKAVTALAAWKPAKASVEIHERCKVEWLEWSGTRNHPRCDEMKAEGCLVEIKGQTATITFTDGRKMTKRASTRGFYFKSEG